MGTNDVHVPRVPHPRFAGKSGLGTRGDVILQLDWTIGEVMRTLDSLGIADNTLLVFTSDNGPAIDDGYQDEAAMRLGGHTPSGIYRGGKYSLYEAGTRVPFIVRWPSCVKPGEQSAVFSQIDVYRSLAALTGVALPEGAAPDSRNHLPELLGMGHSDREYVIEQNRQNTLAIRCGEWKYLEPSDRQSYEYRKSVELGNSPRPQLFCISKDPCERHDNGRPGDQGYPIRGIVRNGWLYLCNIKPWLLPGGNPETGYRDIDSSPTKTAILQLKRSGQDDRYYALSMGQRPAEELYHVETDRECLTNRIGEISCRILADSLRAELFQTLREQGDPRMTDDGDVFDRYPYDKPGKERIYERTVTGEIIPWEHSNWVLPTDYELQTKNRIL